MFKLPMTNLRANVGDEPRHVGLFDHAMVAPHLLAPSMYHGRKDKFFKSILGMADVGTLQDVALHLRSWWGQIPHADRRLDLLIKEDLQKGGRPAAQGSSRC